MQPFVQGFEDRAAGYGLPAALLWKIAQQVPDWRQQAADLPKSTVQQQVSLTPMTPEQRASALSPAQRAAILAGENAAASKASPLLGQAAAATKAKGGS